MTNRITERINHGAPKHRCPVCNHTCQPRDPKLRRRQNPQKTGRPPLERMKLISILRERSNFNPMPVERLMDELGIERRSVFTAIYRARQVRWNILSDEMGMYYLGKPERFDPIKAKNGEI